MTCESLRDQQIQLTENLTMSVSDHKGAAKN